MTECRGDGVGWRRDEYGNLWPCQDELGPLLTPREWREKQAPEGAR